MPKYVFGFLGTNPANVGTLMKKSSAILNKRTFHPSISNLRFIYLGDSRSNSNTHPINETALISVLRAAVSKHPDVMLFGGDMGKFGGAATLKRFTTIVQREVLNKGIPLFVIPGNHEYYGDSGLDDYLRLIGLPNFIIRIPKFNFSLYALNDVLKIASKTLKIPKDQFGFNFNHNMFTADKPTQLLNVSLATLNAELKAHSSHARNTVFAMHAAPSFPKWEKALSPQFRQPNPKYEYLFVKGRNSTAKTPGFISLADSHARYVISSHLHVRTTNVIGTVKKGSLPTRYLISGNAGAPLEPGVVAKNQKVFKEVHNFVLFTVTPTSIIHQFFEVK